MSDEADKTPIPTVTHHGPWASASTVERYHLEDGQWKIKHGDLIKEQGWEIRSIKDRLNTGSESFTKMDLRIKTIEETKNPTWRTVLTFALIAGPWVWVLAQYPNGEKFEMLQEKVRAQEVNQASMARDIKDVQKQQDKSDAKLDQILLRLTNGPVNQP